MVNIGVNHNNDDIAIDNVIFDLQEQNELIFTRIGEFIEFLDNDNLYEQNRVMVGLNFYQYLDETCNVWKQDQELVDDLIRITNKYLNVIWLNARDIAIQEGVAYPDERHIRDRHYLALLEVIHYFMDTYINNP